ncbi:unnamed protein product [Oikopleura dioica]|uniref:Uncharacterized protein n=1 Tax=Oikopleura dioica TaxID=34765 RepID=E4Z1V6_OIKDI|nr:unnamed protein product [Oikopleura dioica]
MVAMTSLGFGNTLEKTLNKLDKVLLNEGLLKVCGDAGWDKGDFNNDRVALARILLNLGADAETENKYGRTAIQIADVRDRGNLAEFLQNPNQHEEHPALKRQLTMERILKDRQNREQKLLRQREQREQQPHPLSLFDKFNQRRSSQESLASPSGIRQVELRGLGQTKNDRPWVTKGQALTLNVPKSAVTRSSIRRESCDLNDVASAPSSPTNSTCSNRSSSSVSAMISGQSATLPRNFPRSPQRSLSNSALDVVTSPGQRGPVVKGQNKIEMKIGQRPDRTFLPKEPLINYSLNSEPEEVSSPMGAIQNQRLVELMSNQVKNLQVQKQGMEMAMMEMKNEMANERQVFHREKEKWMREMNRMKAAQELERKEFERQKYIFTKKLEYKDKVLEDARGVLSSYDDLDFD